jgi:hypothetical protein
MKLKLDNMSNNRIINKLNADIKIFVVNFDIGHPCGPTPLLKTYYKNIII